MVRQCVVRGCHSRSAYALLCFPLISTDPERHAAWVHFVRQTRPGWRPCDESRSKSTISRSVICSEHFATDCFINLLQVKHGFAKRLVLNNTAVPTIYHGDHQDHIHGNVTMHDVSYLAVLRYYVLMDYNNMLRVLQWLCKALKSEYAIWIKFHIASLTYKLLHSHTQSYLASTLHKHNLVRDLRSGNLDLLHQPPVTRVIGSRAFYSVQPCIFDVH